MEKRTVNKSKKSSKKKTSQKLSLLKRINSKEDYDKLSEKEVMIYKNELTKKMTDLINSQIKGEGGGRELMELVENVKFISNQEYIEKKNITWEINHELILSAISDYVKDYQTLPSVTRLSHRLDLSRNTITKHLKKYHKEHEEDDFQRLKMLRDKGLLMMYSYGIRDSNMQALNIFFNTVSKMEKVRGESIKTQNNYIQFNDIKIEESMLKNLSQEKLDQIMDIINAEAKTINIKSK